MWLSTEKRKALNDLVLQLNGLISDAIDKTNNAQGRKQVHFVDTNPQFDDQHRWCEAGDFHEPDPGRLDTWFFLSGWSDITVLDDAITTEINVTEEVSAVTLLENRQPCREDHMHTPTKAHLTNRSG
jgi:hypothetical protein